MSDRRWHRRGVIALLVTLLVAAVTVSGCSQATRYDVLTFFFTGVPEPGEEAASEARTAATTPTAREKRRSGLKFLGKAQFFMHGPFGAGQCERCHATAASKPFRTGKAQVSEKVISQAPSIGPRLAFPWEELCVTCHSEKSPAAAKADGLWQHGPVAKGWCTLCHSPHKSKRQYMLLKENNVELCTQCHSTNDLQITAQHKQDPAADCISCHNPHVGKSTFLLKAEYDEWQGL
ncbi:MAG: cytochrome c3 family protein [Gammaproteobacteria bacterium]|nr:cytochrome c3 family protein [Gammaproteobacteria bacterium]